MLDPASVWVDEFKKIPPAKTAIEGVTNLANTVEKLTNKVEPNAPIADYVAPGIFQFNKAIFIAQLLSLIPTQTPAWIPKVANAWSSACMSGIITPGKVTISSVWLVSFNDILTVPTAAVTLPTISVGQAAFMSTMTVVPTLTLVDPSSAQESFAKAFYVAASSLSFALIGLGGTPLSPVPIPMTFPAK